ncbi:unnamed protein product [Rhizophagus irregularis]|uniref:RZ-type domain-containing protein n=1 Tax=Rhizophagus irregularis TaxID=588596 RepID=A0A916EET7_9GLOM|nr:unnamed protein product [Rhizophagus irregularis]
MALMLLRTRANIPVVVCGEAGCGKTSLIGFLAGVVEVEFRALNIHAVCILNRIPLFIVGSPGSSKSLAIRLVHQNLRGSDSNDEYFRTLPQVFFIPHQGSSSSTSDVVILGSQFPEDRDDYSYNILSRIMMCVEAGQPLILTDLEIIYGSLYDLWNQNYITMGSSDDPKYFTRVALGAYANPMLYVHPDFRFNHVKYLNRKILEHPNFDFVSIICNSETSLKNISVLSYILKCKLGKEEILNPILLHTFWWEHANSTLAAFQLVHMCPNIVNQVYMDDADLTNENFDDYLVDEVTNMMFRKIIKSQETIELQREIKKVLNLCEKVSGFTRTESFQLLQICYDLLSTELITLDTIKEIIKTRETRETDDDEIFSARFIHDVFEIFRNIETVEAEQENKITFAKQSFVMKSLEIIPFESPSRLELYHYSDMENCFSILYSYNNRDQFNQIFKALKRKESINARISFMGIILNRLHAIRATKDWAHVENQVAGFLNEKIEQISSLSIIYRQIITKITTNQCPLLYLNIDTSNSDLLIKSVVGHVIALHSSLPADASPLANLLQNLNYCNGLYILTCPSDVESIILSAVFQKNGQFTRYQCKCGYVYLIGDCGQANGRG